MADGVPCHYCESERTIDCGDNGDGTHHFECKACRCAFIATRTEILDSGQEK